MSSNLNKRYNSVSYLGFSIDHDKEDGFDITADEIREKLREAIKYTDEELKDLILGQMQFKKESHYLELGETGLTKNLSKTGG